MRRLKWGILATGNIATTFAKATKLAGNGEILAVASRTQQSADEFGAKHEVPRRYSSYQQLLDDPDIEAVYVSPPHPMHHEWVIKAAKARKHILCEKPIAMNYRETKEMIDAARENGVALMEAFMYRFHPQTAKLLELIREKTIGEIRLIQGIYGFTVPFNPEGRIYNKALGGGGILDVGCYPVSSTRLIAGAALGKPFADPVDVQAQGYIGDTGVDEWTSAVVKFPGNIVAQWTTGVRLPYENGVRIYGTGGWIHIPRPHHPSYWGGDTQIIVNRGWMAPLQEITIHSDRPLFTIAIEAFAKAVLEGKKQVDAPGMSWDDTLGNARAIDAWRERIGLRYDADLAGA